MIDIFYSYAIIFSLYRVHCLMRHEEGEEEVLDLTDAAEQLEKTVNPSMIFGLVNFVWILIGGFSVMANYFCAILLITFIPYLFIFFDQPKYVKDGHITCLCIIKIIIAAHIFISHFFLK